MWILLTPFFDGIKENVVDAVAPWVDVFFMLVTTPFEFDWVSTFMTFYQAVAIAIIFIIVMARGIAGGIFGEATGQGEGPLAYLARSFVPILLVAATPAIVGVVTTVTTGIARAVASTGNEGFATALLTQLYAILAGTSPMAPSVPGIVTAIVLLATLYYVIVICSQCLSRWVQLTVYSIITPLTCIFTAAEDSGDYVSILKSMSYTGVVTVIQLLLLQSAAYMPAAGAAILADAELGLAASAAALSVAQMGSVMLTIAVLGATKQVPSWIEKFTCVPSVAGRGNVGRATSSAVRTATSVARTFVAKGRG